MSETTWKVARALWLGPATCRELAIRAKVRKQVVFRRLWRLQQMGWVTGRQLEQPIGGPGRGWWSKRWWLTVAGFAMVRPTYRRRKDEQAA